MESYKIKRSYELLNQDDVVAAFDIVGFHVRSVTRYRTGNVQIFNPVVYRNAIGAIPLQVFLTTRRAPGHRAYMDELFRKLNFEDLVTYLNLTYGLSLIDTLWIRPKGSEISWSDVNLFDNRFSEGIARYALTGSGLEGLQFDRPSPEFTTDGALPKAWTRDKNGVIYLRKSSTAYLGFRNAGYEPYAEYYAGQAAQQCGILPSVSYDLSNDSGAICSLCPLFTSKDVAYLSMDHYMAIHGITDSGKYMDVLQELGLLDQYLNMVLFDCIICNSDRHLGNFGVLAETRDYTPISLSPIFDNGMSLGVFWMPDNDKDIIRFALESGPSLLNRGNFLEVGRKLLTDANKTCVENLREWQIQPHPQYNWGDEKVHAMNELLRYQVENILGRHSGA